MLDQPASLAEAGVVLMLESKVSADARYGMGRANIVFLAILLVVPGAVSAQREDDIKELKLRDWQPRSMLITKATSISKSAFPAVDVHNHLGGGKATLTPERVKRYLDEMDSAGVRAVVNLDGGWGERLEGNARCARSSSPGAVSHIRSHRFFRPRRAAVVRQRSRRLPASFDAGAKGLKFHKVLGLGVRYKSGQFLGVDDPKLDAIWEVCAGLQAAGGNSHGRPRGLFHAARSIQRALARIE